MADAATRAHTPKYESPGSFRHRGPYLHREPESSRFVIWLAECNPLRNLPGLVGPPPTHELWRTLLTSFQDHDAPGWNYWKGQGVASAIAAIAREILFRLWRLSRDWRNQSQPAISKTLPVAR